MEADSAVTILQMIMLLCQLANWLASYSLGLLCLATIPKKRFTGHEGTNRLLLPVHINHNNQQENVSCSIVTF